MKKLLLTMLFFVLGITTFAQNQKQETKSTKSLQDANPILVIDNKVLGSVNDPEVKKIMDNLDKDNIENISVLKDSTVCIKLYGVKAKFGVILITTKKQ